MILSSRNKEATWQKEQRGSQVSRASGSSTGLERPTSELRACHKECARQMPPISSQDEGKAKQTNVSKDPCPALHACSVTQSHPILCDSIGCSPPGSSVHGILRQEYWMGLPCPPPGDLPDPGIETMSLASPTLAGGFLTTRATWEAPNLQAYWGNFFLKKAHNLQKLTQ